MEIKDENIFDIFLNHFLKFLLYGGGVFGFLKVLVLMNGWRIFSFFRVYWNQEKLFNHKLFNKIDFLIKSGYLVYNVKDIAKKEIAKDLVIIELFRIKQILKNNLKIILKNNLKDYIKSFSEFKAENVVSLFINEYTESRAVSKEFARRKITKNSFMTQEDFNRFWSLYSEISITYEVFIFESIVTLKHRKNIYQTIWHILDNFEVLVELIFKTVGHNINIMNGRSYGIKYKGYTIGVDIPLNDENTNYL